MPETPKELDVFRLPHVHMKQLVKDIDQEVRDRGYESIMIYLTIG